MSSLDPVIHAPNRLKICAMLSTSAELEFKLIKEQLDVSDSVLSKHLKALEVSTYIRLQKRTEFGRQKTWISLTSNGREAFKKHVNALKRIVGIKL
ncbi:MAG: transcriptional regulator [Enterobacterales bacterium]|nr:transcriptional regulator [Enterobacterales bacterium]